MMHRPLPHMEHLKLTKKGTQELLRNIRAEGYQGDRKTNGYEVHLDGTLMFKAWIGRFDYLISYHPNFITRED